LLRIVLKVPAVPEFAVTDAVDAQASLLSDHLSHLPYQSGAIGSIGAWRRSRSNRRQPAGMGRFDRGFASLHVASNPCAVDSIA
jgi:hypothetical protein